LEYAQNVAGIKNAGHTEINPHTLVPLIVLASHPVANRPESAPRLWGKLNIRINLESQAYRSYNQVEVMEPFACNYELNPAFRRQLEAGGLKVSGTSGDGGTRIVELPGRDFFLATSFIPQLNSEETKPHPLIVGFLRAAQK
jgi:CTP synthase (UTP-ammonia lyase)